MLPFKTTLSNLGLFVTLAALVGLILYRGIATISLKMPSFYLGSTLALYIPLLLGTIYTPYPEAAQLQLVKCIFFLLLPLILLCKDLEKDKMLLWSSWGLIIGVTCSALYLQSMNLNNFLDSNQPLIKFWSYDFTGRAFVAPFKDMHPVYYGSYLLFMLVLLWQRRISIPLWLKIVLSIFVLTVLVSLNSRMILLLTLILGLVFIARKLSAKQIIIALAGALLLLVFTFPALKKTYIYNKTVSGSMWELRENVGQQNLDRAQKSDSRMARWLVGLDIYFEKPIMGHGTGSARKILVEQFEKRNMTVSAQQNYDTHNQYLAYAINYGIIGLFFIFGYLGINYYRAVISKDWILLAFVIMITGLCITENYLIRNMGINFVALFGNLLILSMDD